jgi:hypothetical protein
MKAYAIVRRAFFAMMVAAVPLSTQAADSKADLEAAVKEVEQAAAELAKAKDASEVGKYWADNAIDIHPSGWRYDKPDSLQISPNLRKLGGTSKAIKSGVVERKVFPINKDTVVVTTVNETYYEVPNPQDVARAAGTMTFDPEAIAKVAASQGRAPGVGASPTLYRNRNLAMWARIDGRWQIALRQATDIGPAAIPGR